VRTDYLTDGANTEVKPALKFRNVIPVQGFSTEKYADVADRQAVAQVGEAIDDTQCWNNFPHVRVTWITCPSHIGHPGGHQDVSAAATTSTRRMTTRRSARSATPATTW
jgi:hypothetical protein